MIYEKYSDEWFLDLYFKYGSVEEAMRNSDQLMPISHATYHRKVKSAGLIGSAGRHVSLPEVLHFFRMKALEPGTPVERLYKKMPHKFKTSLVTLHRIYNAVEKQIVRRHATVLLISDPSDKHRIVVGKETNSNSRYGKNVGDISVPTGFSKKDESNEESILRVLQEEFSTQLAIESKLKNYFEIKDISPFMTFDIIDVRLKVFHLVCPDELKDLKKCSSYKLNNHSFASVLDLGDKQNLRTGASEIIRGYIDYLNGGSYTVVTSKLNSALIGMESNPELALRYRI